MKILVVDNKQNLRILFEQRFRKEIKAMKPGVDGFHTKLPDFNSLKQKLGEKKLS